MEVSGAERSVAIDRRRRQGHSADTTPAAVVAAGVAEERLRRGQQHVVDRVDDAV